MNTTVLIVEDDCLLGIALYRLFAQLGFHVIGPARSYEDALTNFKTHRPDLVIMDIQLESERNGVEAAFEIRSMGQTPIVFQSSWTDPYWIRQARELNGTILVDKTISLPDWQGILNHIQIPEWQMVA